MVPVSKTSIIDCSVAHRNDGAYSVSPGNIGIAPVRVSSIVYRPPVIIINRAVDGNTIIYRTVVSPVDSSISPVTCIVSPVDSSISPVTCIVSPVDRSVCPVDRSSPVDSGVSPG